MNISDCLTFGWPTAQYSVGETYESLQWFSEDIPKPTEQEINEQWPLFQQSLLLKKYTLIIEAQILEVVKSYSYDSAVSMASYVTSTNQTWKNEAVAFVAWRDTVYQYAISVLTAAEQGGQVPSLDDFISGIPEWTPPS